MWFLPALAAVLLIGVDQATKYLALLHLKPVGSVTWIEGFMDFTFVENRGVAFGLFSGQRWLILLLTGAITVGLLYYYYKLPKTGEYRFVRISMVMIFAGAVGNLIDRMLRGYVVDFFEFTFFDWPVFNMADIFVVLGVTFLCFLILFVIKDEDMAKKKEE